MTIGLIAAVDLAGTLAYDGKIPWREPADLKRFKAITMGCSVIMGRKTYESLPSNKLPGREMFVLSSKHHQKSDHTYWFAHIDDAIAGAQSLSKNIWIIGGGEIYRETLDQKLPEIIDLSIINYIWKENLIFDNINRTMFAPIPYCYQVDSETQNPDSPTLFHRRYSLRQPSR